MADQDAADPGRRKLETKHLLLGYALSRLDRKLLEALGTRTWKATFEVAARALDARATSIKNLRDEFDPLHRNSRVGWVHRPPRPAILRVAGELAELSDDALIELVRATLGADRSDIAQVLDSLAEASTPSTAAAERLATGRRAEAYVQEHAERLFRCKSSALIDMREAMQGYDFRIEASPIRFVEVKGLRAATGSLAFTDHEWHEAKRLRQAYLLAVVTRLDSAPMATVITDPSASPLIRAECRYRTAPQATWIAPWRHAG